MLANQETRHTISFNVSDSVLAKITPAGENLLAERTKTGRNNFLSNRHAANVLGYESVQIWNIGYDLGAAITSAEDPDQPITPILFRSIEDPFHIDDQVVVKLSKKGLHLILEDAARIEPKHPLTIAHEEWEESIIPFSTMLRVLCRDYVAMPSDRAMNLNFAFLLNQSTSVA